MATKKVSTTKKTEAPVTVSKNQLAVVAFGPHQYKVKIGDVISVEKLDLAAGAKYSTNEVLLYSDESVVKVGTPKVDSASVVFEHVSTTKGDKIRIARFHHKSRHRRVIGHRQTYTNLKVLEINLG